jgi:YHS domain-containing protein
MYSTGAKVPPKNFMLRALVEMVVTLVAIYLVREIIAIFTRSFKGGFGGFSGSGGTSPGAPPKSPPGTLGELKKDPVCGTFISTQTAFQKVVHGETYYFCSMECRDKFKG